MSGGEILGQVSHSETVYDRFDWVIPDTVTQNSTQPPVCRSPSFLLAKSTWHLSLWSRGTKSDKDMVLTLWRTSKCSSKQKVRVGIRKKGGGDHLKSEKETDRDGFFEVRKFLLWSEMVNIISSERQLTVFCEMMSERSLAETAMLMDKSTSLLIQNLGQLFQEGLNSDAVVKVEGREFKVHKAILASRSPVLASMFQHDMAENNSGVADIPDCKAEAFKAFLLHIYTGKTDDISLATVFDLYYVSDKYCIQDLKERCVQFMKENLSVDCFCDVISLALLHSEPELIEIATSFFSQNMKVIIKTVRWQKYLTQNPIHANELYIKALDA